MAKYAISKEGAESLNQLSNNLFINANNIVEANAHLEQVMGSLDDGLGIYGDEIIGIIHRNRQILNNNREAIENLAMQLKKQAREVEEMVAMELGDFDSTSTERHSGIRGIVENIFGKKGGSKNDDLAIPFGNGITVSQDKRNSDVFFVNGNHSKEFMDYWTHVDEFTVVPIDNESIIYINARDIEGIHLNNNDISDVDGFWGRRTGGTQESFVNIAQDIPKVKNLLESGMDYHEIRSAYPELSDCVDIYFESAPSVCALNDFYVFSFGGRHREMAAQTIDGMIPVKVKSIITRK